MQKLKAAVIGAGYLGRFHAQKYAALPNATLVGIVDVAAEARERVAAELGTEAFADYRALLGTPLPVPATAIYSRSDGIVHWQSCRELEGPLSENIEVQSSHCGIGHHPVALLTIADRLAQPEGAWKPFVPPARWRWPLAPRAGATS